MKHLTELLTYRALHFKLSSVTGSDFLLERAIEDDNTASAGAAAAYADPYIVSITAGAAAARATLIGAVRAVAAVVTCR